MGIQLRMEYSGILLLNSLMIKDGVLNPWSRKYIIYFVGTKDLNPSFCSLNMDQDLRSWYFFPRNTGVTVD